MDRRSFFQRVVAFTWGFITLLAGVPLFGYLITPAVRRRKKKRLALPVKADDIFEGDPPLKVDYIVENQDGWVRAKHFRTAFILKGSDGKLVVFSNICTHAGCSVSWDEKQERFLCLCHDGQFDRNGGVIKGPPPRPLTRLKHEVKRGKLYIEVEA